MRTVATEHGPVAVSPVHVGTDRVDAETGTGHHGDVDPEILDGLVGQGKHVVVLGDLNEGPVAAGGHAANLSALYDDDSPLIECYALAGFDTGARPGTFDSCGLRNRLDYIFISKSLEASFSGGALFRKGLWGSRVTRPTDWETYAEMTRSVEQASDHAAVFVELDI